MDQKIRRVHPPAFKAKVVLEALKEQKTLAELSSQFGVHSMMISKWKQRAPQLTHLHFVEANEV